MFQNMVKASKKFEQLLIDSANEEAKVSNEINVGDWTLTAASLSELQDLSAASFIVRGRLERLAGRCCQLLGIDPTTDSVARDICEEIVLHGTPVSEVINKLQRHLEGGQ